MSKVWYEISEITDTFRRIPAKVPHQDMGRERVDNLDIARGIAISLMFLSHTVMALHNYRTLPEFGLVPIHTITKFSSSLFILVFGVTVALFYAPSCRTDRWPAKRNRLLWRSFTILVWYKLLAYTQMFETYPTPWIVETMYFARFTDFAEVLNFYWLAILWLTLLLPLWTRIHGAFKLFLIALLIVSGTLLNQHFDFWGVWQIKAMLVEHDGTYCYGQFQRGALALFGLFLGGFILIEGKIDHTRRKIVGAVCILLGLIFFGYFLYLTRESAEVRALVIKAISKNFGKHPPNVHFSVFSLGGAFVIMGGCLLLSASWGSLLEPFAVIGKESFFSFNYHIILIFVGFRYLLGLRWKISYGETMFLLLVVFVSCYLLAPINTHIKKQGVLWKWLLP